MLISKKIFILTIIGIRLSINAFSQGSWEIEYISIDSLNSSFIGKEIRIDFKSFSEDKVNGNVSVLSIRNLLSHEDTANLNIHGKSIQFVEQWKLYVDSGILSDQDLKEVKGDFNYQIKGMTLTAIDNSSIIVEAKIYGSSCKMKKEIIVINKSDIKGILTGIY